jgi:hypothetical protein
VHDYDISAFYRTSHRALVYSIQCVTGSPVPAAGTMVVATTVVAWYTYRLRTDNSLSSTDRGPPHPTSSRSVQLQESQSGLSELVFTFDFIKYCTT